MLSTIPHGSAPSTTAFVDSVARLILSQHSQRMPDLRRVRIVLPNNHVALSLAQSLVHQAGVSAILLPQMVTLRDWAHSTATTLPVVPDTCRILNLYQALRVRRWFPDADLWVVASELLVLLDELTQYHVALPQDEDEFISQLERAYQAKRGIAMQFEARLVYELWYAMSSNGELDTARDYQQRLVGIAQQAELPLYVLLTSDLEAPEARFLEAYRERAPVVIINLCEMVLRQPECAAMRVIAPAQTGKLGSSQEDSWMASDCPPLGVQEKLVEMDSLSLREQAAHLKRYFPDASLGMRLSFFGARSLEEEARAAEVQVRRWLLAGKKKIAIVAYDRIVARRVCALLGRADVLVRDEVGWKFSTLSVSTVLIRWLDTLQSDFYYQNLLDLLKSAFIFSDQSAPERKQTVYQLEQLIRRHGIVRDLDAFIGLARDSVEIRTMLMQLRQAERVLHKKSDTISGWLRALYVSLEAIGIVQGLKVDVAGIRLLQLLEGWQCELRTDSTRLSLTEWRCWLMQQLDAHTFCDSGIDSPVVLTHLAAMRWRCFDAVLMIGCDDTHLPTSDGGGPWFNEAVRASLGLPTREAHLRRQRDDLLALLAMSGTVVITWQANKNGEENLLSPYLEMLRSLHDLTYGDDLTTSGAVWRPLLEGAQVAGPEFALPHVSAMPLPVAAHELVPRRISASGYNSLMACPYQFYARYILRLNEIDEVREGIEKRDYGGWVHEILHRFHERHPQLAEHDREDLRLSMERISDEIFEPVMRNDFLARAWLLRWKKSIHAYLDAQLNRESGGWRYREGETPFELALADDLTMHGRVDRVDIMADGSDGVCVLDYKMTGANTLRNKLKEAGEDVQLACYAYVHKASTAAFISIEKDKVVAVAPQQDVGELAGSNIQRLLEVFTQMRGGAALPAHGTRDACKYCEMHGLCRKSEWSTL